MPTDSSKPSPTQPRIQGRLRQSYAFLRLLSLDVVAGAVGGGMMADRYAGCEMHWSFFLVLGLSVWSIYTLDHLLDAKRLGAAASTARHAFHHHNFKILTLFWAMLSLLAAVLAFNYLGWNGIYFGVGMAGLTLLHLLLVKLVGDKTSPFLVKEFGVALVYSAGIWGLPLIEGKVWLEPVAWANFGIFLLLATINLLEFSLFEVEIDQKDGHSSFVRALGRKHAKRLVGTLLGLSFLGMVGSGFLTMEGKLGMRFEGGWLLPIYALMWMVLLALWLFPRYFGRFERYRVWGDGAFLLPFLCLWT